MKIIREKLIHPPYSPEEEKLKGKMLDEIIDAYYPLSLFQNKRQQEEAKFSYASELALTCKFSVVKQAYDQFKKSPMTEADAEDVVTWLETRRPRKDID